MWNPSGRIKPLVTLIIGFHKNMEVKLYIMGGQVFFSGFLNPRNFRHSVFLNNEPRTRNKELKLLYREFT